MRPTHLEPVWQAVVSVLTEANDTEIVSATTTADYGYGGEVSEYHSALRPYEIEALADRVIVRIEEAT